jgi:hydrogenase maturation factor HypF (carbamoyltransferase family)
MSNRKPHFGSIFQRKKRLADGSVITLPKYWIQYCRDGRIYRESTKTANYAEAERLLKRRQGELVTGRFAGLEPERVLVAQLLDDVLEDFAANARKSLSSVEGGNPAASRFRPHPGRSLRYERAQEIHREPEGGGGGERHDQS